ncbi:MHYT domain-containing protein [Nocardiopsis lambiniae]|uniref:MHYT domain-containing protein n=1 Tax=Nocardiopsis lambiniae TaxID=3075539 RepID=A0ABU2M8Y3_9ACTN|nr:MHYT domain-containing protein [Nocardiopsis sp. DSM 44743]MDT0329038.1 MHYT domain-containing protein [Nocardiopsis sp. DSM 44743]
MLDDVFGQDWLTPAIALTVSAIGSFLGLSFAYRARRTTGLARWQWTGLAALSLGGMAVWSMHFIAMMGFRLSGTAIRYDPTLTIASGVIAIVVMGGALVLTLHKRTGPWLLFSGLLLGSGVLAMHYIGVASMNVHGELHQDPRHVIASCVIALIAATVALWFASRLRGVVPIIGASLLMGVAVTSMHYTGMAGVHVEAPDFTRYGAPEGSTVPDLLLPMIVVLFVFLLVCSLFLLLGVEEERVDYARRPGHAAPDPAETVVRPEEAGYAPRHASAPPVGSTSAVVRPSSDDVWSRRR